MNNIKIDKFLINDVSWTLKHFTRKMCDWAKTCPDNNEMKDPYKEAANAILIVINQGFGDCYPIDLFIEAVNYGGFVDYDGVGYFVDVEGKELGPIHCDVKWLTENRPEDAEFIMWYNK